MKLAFNILLARERERARNLFKLISSRSILKMCCKNIQQRESESALYRGFELDLKILHIEVGRTVYDGLSGR